MKITTSLASILSFLLLATLATGCRHHGYYGGQRYGRGYRQPGYGSPRPVYAPHRPVYGTPPPVYVRPRY